LFQGCGLIFFGHCRNEFLMNGYSGIGAIKNTFILQSMKISKFYIRQNAGLPVA